MNVELQTESSTKNPTQTAIKAARGDYMSDSLIGVSFEEVMDGTEKNKREFVRELLRRGHFGPLEHAQVFFAVEGISRVTMAQITRHRHLSFDVQSQRYVNFDDAEMVIPESVQAAFENPEGWMEMAVDEYQELLDRGVPEEDARYVLPLGTKVNMTFSGNIRSLLHVLDLRDSGAAQNEIQKLSKKLIEELRGYCPIIIEEWESHCKNASLQSP